MRKRFRLAAVLLFFSTASTVATSQPAIEPTAGSRTVSVSVSAAASEGLDLPDGAELVATELGSGERIRRVSLEGERIELELPSQESWRLCLEARGSWAPCRTVSATTTLADLPVWPAAALAGRLRFVGGKGDPTLLKLTIGPPPGPGPTGPLEDAVVTCEIDEEEARFTCPIPAAEIYAAVRVSGFVSRYFWGLEPEPGRATDLGSIQMQPGASLSGMVDLSIEGADGRRTVARLVPALSARVPPSVAASVEKEAKTSGVGPYGFFQFADVTPGSYMLEASHPGFATTRVGPFEVFAGKETELVAPVVLLHPIDLEVFVTPALSPLGDPWQVHVFRARDWSAGSQEVYRGAADRSGRLSVRQQSPGEFQIAITDRLGNRFHSQRVRLEPGDAGFVPIDVALVEVKGDLDLVARRSPACFTSEAGREPYGLAWKRLKTAPSTVPSAVAASGKSRSSCSIRRSKLRDVSRSSLAQMGPRGWKLISPIRSSLGAWSTRSAGRFPALGCAQTRRPSWCTFT